MCAIRATSSTLRWIQRNQVSCTIGSPMVRSQCAYESNSASPKKIFRFPAMWTTTNASISSPVTAITIFLPIVDRYSVLTDVTRVLGLESARRVVTVATAER